MPPFEDWLKASWDDFRRRWGRLMTVIGLAGVATLAAVAIPLVPALLLGVFHIGPLWLVVTAGSLASVSAALWVSTWGQAAAVRAAVFDEPAGESLSRGWAQTAAFGWVITLSCLAVGGGLCLFVLPAAFLSLFLFFAPYYEITGESAGVDALGLSWARVVVRPGEACLRLLAAFALAWFPSRIPYVGWLISMFWAPIGLIATARLAADLRAAAPDARAPLWMGKAVAGLSAVLLVGVFGVSSALAYAARRALPMASALSGRMLSGGLDPETGKSLIAVLSGDATAEQRRQASSFVVSASSTAWNADLSSATVGGFFP
jgi:hypothetical protein